MSAKLDQLSASLTAVLGAKITRQVNALGEITIECKSSDYLAVCQLLRDDAGLKFEQLIDLCGVDYQDYGDGTYDGLRYAVVIHLLSVSLNQRLRLRADGLHLLAADGEGLVGAGQGAHAAAHACANHS